VQVDYLGKMNGFSLFFGLTLTAASLFAQAPDVLPTPRPSPSPTVATPGMNATTSEAEPMPLSQSVFLDVKDLGTNLSSNANWRSVWGSYSKDTKRARGLEISLRNPAKIPGEYLVSWYFFATSVRGGKRFLFDLDKKNITLGPGGSEKATVISDTLQSQTVHYAYDDYYYNYHYKSGNKPEGWIVTVSVAGNVIRVKTSGAQLEELYKKTEEFQAMLEAVGK
jgi:hypothetical protein